MTHEAKTIVVGGAVTDEVRRSMEDARAIMYLLCEVTDKAQYAKSKFESIDNAELVSVADELIAISGRLIEEMDNASERSAICPENFQGNTTNLLRKISEHQCLYSERLESLFKSIPEAGGWELEELIGALKAEPPACCFPSNTAEQMMSQLATKCLSGSSIGVATKWL